MEYEPIFFPRETSKEIESEIDTIYNQFHLALSKLPTQFSIIKRLTISNLESILASIREMEIQMPNTYLTKYQKLGNKIKSLIEQIEKTLPGMMF